MAFVTAFLSLIAAAASWVLASVALARATVPVLQTLAPWLSYWTVTGWLFFLLLVGVFFFLFRSLFANRQPRASL
jgi:hypothetical protein